MGDRHLLRIFVGLNAALATCFVVYLFLSSGGSQQAFVTTNFPVALPDYSIKRPEFLFLKLAETQQVRVSAVASSAP